MDSIYGISLAPEQYEVIIIDDCSPYGADKALGQYLERHSNIRIVRHKVNKRQGGAKNTGIAAAKGEYIAFADQDDIVVSSNLPSALDFAKNNEADMVACHYCMQGTDGCTKEYGIDTGHMAITTGKDFCENHFQANVNLAPWAVLYRREFLILTNHPYEENVLMEDSDWIAWHWIHAATVGIYNQPIYTWIANRDSITHSKSYMNRADFLYMGYRKIRDAQEYCEISPAFSNVMSSDGRYNIDNTVRHIWKVDDYRNFYLRIKTAILPNLQQMRWGWPASIYIYHPKASTAFLLVLGPVVKGMKRVLKNG